MASVQEIVNELHALKMSSEQLSTMFAGAGQNLQQNCSNIAAIVQGSRTGMEATQALTVATQSLLNAAASIKTLGGTCDECIAKLSK